jgi:Cytidylate kinase-like family
MARTVLYFHSFSLERSAFKAFAQDAMIKCWGCNQRLSSAAVERVKLPREMLDADSIVRISETVVQQASTEGNCVIVGRGSQPFLRSRDDTLRFLSLRFERRMK